MKAFARDEDTDKISFTVLNLAYLNDISLERRKIVNDLLIRKDEGVDRIHRFRNITIIEEDLPRWSFQLLTFH